MTETRTSPKFFDIIDSIDRYFYGRKMKNFIIGALLVVIAAPALDEFLDVPHDRLTYYATLFFFLYTLLLILAWISSFRDENGQWRWKRVWARIVTYLHILKNTAQSTKTNSRDELLYKVAWILLIFGLCLKATQNLSVFVRKPIENLFNIYVMRFRNFEVATRHWYWITPLIGVIILGWLIKHNRHIATRIKEDIIHFFGRSNRYTGETISEQVFTGEVVVHTKRDDHMNNITSASESKKFNRFIHALQTWQPQNCRLEYEYQDSLLEHLSKEMHGAAIDSEYPLPDPVTHKRKRGDIVIDHSILIEMKRECGAGEIQRAQGQIMEYTSLWNKRGPVVLLLCNHEYDAARNHFEPTMRDLQKLNRPALTIVQTH